MRSHASSQLYNSRIDLARLIWLLIEREDYENRVVVDTSISNARSYLACFAMRYSKKIIAKVVGNMKYE